MRAELVQTELQVQLNLRMKCENLYEYILKQDYVLVLKYSCKMSQQ